MEAPEVRRPKTVAAPGTVSPEQKAIRGKPWKERRAEDVDPTRDLPPVGWVPSTAKRRGRKPSGA